MDLITYPSMDAFPFKQQQLLFDPVDDTFEMEQLLAAAFDSSSPELFQYHSNEDDICFDPLYSASQFFVDDKNDVFLADDDSLLYPQNLIISPFDQFHHSDINFHKRQKINQNEYDSSSFLLDLAAPPPQVVATPPPQPLPFSIPPVFSYGISSNNNNNGGITGEKNEMEESRSLSAQSLSARQRRRKISEKTKELGKLVPGGQKMNTAEMFEAASSYIKFLQAQFAILQLMESPTPSSSSSSVHNEEDLQCLIGSPLVQEKLYLKQKCIAPKGLVESLKNNDEIQSSSQTLKDVRNLILTFC